MAVNGKIALVTGAGSGIGRSAAIALLGEGYAVVLAGRRRDALARTAAEAGPAGTRALAVPTDVADPESVAWYLLTTLDGLIVHTSVGVNQGLVDVKLTVATFTEQELGLPQGALRIGQPD